LKSNIRKTARLKDKVTIAQGETRPIPNIWNGTMLTLTDLYTRRAGLSASAELHVPSSKNSGITVFVNGHQIAQVHSCKYLGLYIDHDLNWKNHIEWAYIYDNLLRLVGIFVERRFWGF